MKFDKIWLLEALILGLFFCAANIRVLFIRGYFLADGAWIELAAEFVLIPPALLMLTMYKRMGAYKHVWLSNWPLLAFIVIAAVSLLWTIDFVATLESALILFLASTLAAYLAVRYSLHQVLKIMAGFFAVLVFFCYLVVFIWPEAGVMSNYPYYGSWRAIFWHRNYLGSTMALGSLLFLLCFCLSFAKQKKCAVFYGLFYVLAFALVILSRSATGLILALVLHAILAGVVLWLKLYPRMRAVHYEALGAVLAGGLIVAYLKLNSLLGFFNRDASFTGRTGLWSYLLTHYISQRPLLGFGFGAFWQQAAIDLQLRDVLGWPYAIVIGDNGYMDILLHLGAVGFVIFAAVLILACVRSVQLALRERTLLTFVPVLVMAYVLITNVTLSYFLETESFTWIVMIAMWFAATPIETPVQANLVGSASPL